LAVLSSATAGVQKHLIMMVMLSAAVLQPAGNNFKSVAGLLY
jgi:hypothetical protein